MLSYLNINTKHKGKLVVLQTNWTKEPTPEKAILIICESNKILNTKDRTFSSKS